MINIWIYNKFIIWIYMINCKTLLALKSWSNIKLIIKFISKSKILKILESSTCICIIYKIRILVKNHYNINN